MWGSATFVTVTSSTCITVTIITEPVIIHFRAAPTGTPPARVSAAIRRSRLRGILASQSCEARAIVRRR
jgi:hypothetical protein